MKTICALLGIAALNLGASTITLNVPASNLVSATPSGLQTRYKIDNTNWDMMLGNGVSVSPSTIVARDNGNYNALNGTQWIYEIANIPTQGVYMYMERADSPTTRYLLAWGSFQPEVLPTTPNTSVTSLGGLSPTPFYNGLHIYAQASQSGSSAVFSNASFTVSTPGVNVTGTLPTSGTATPSGIAEAYIAYTDDLGNRADLTNVQWKFRTNVQLNKTASGGAESVKFEFTGKDMTYTSLDGSSPVPEPASLVMMASALAAAGFLLRQRPDLSAASR